MTTRLEFQAASVRYGGHEALREVDLTAASGELLAITGASGAGKTSLLWLAAGLVPAATGTVAVAGKPLADADQAIENGVVLIPQGNGLAAVLTAHENLLVALLSAGVAAKQAAQRAAEALELMGIGEHGHQLAEELSGGQRQRVAIARGLALRADILLADEVTSDLDSTNRDRTMALLRGEADRGATVLLATHDAEAAAACDVEWHLVDGRPSLVRDRTHPPVKTQRMPSQVARR